jgi:hypothetical protein
LSLAVRCISSAICARGCCGSEQPASGLALGLEVPSSVHLDEPVYQERRSAKSFAIGKYRDVAAGKNLLNCLTGFCRATIARKRF